MKNGTETPEEQGTNYQTHKRELLQKSSEPSNPPNPNAKKKEKVIVKLAHGRKVEIIDIDTRYVGADGTPLNAEEFLKQLVGSLPSLYKDVEQLRTIWKNPSERALLFTELENAGFGAK